MLLDSYGYLKRRIYSVNFSLSLVAKKRVILASGMSRDNVGVTRCRFESDKK